MKLGFIPLLLLGVLAGFAQNPADLLEKAPPDIDEALRARISKFYEAHVSGKFRLADEVVAEDSKDIFFSGQKKQYRSFEISKVTYSENFTKATVVVICDTDMPMPMSKPIPVKLPFLSFWRFEKGQWWWYVDANAQRQFSTPMGTFSQPPASPTGAPPPPSAVGGAPVTPMTPEGTVGLVKADKKELVIDPARSFESQVVISNNMRGPVSLELPKIRTAGLELKLNRTDLKSGEKAVLGVRYEPVKKARPSNLTVKVVVFPVQNVIPIRIRFSGSSAK